MEGPGEPEDWLARRLAICNGGGGSTSDFSAVCRMRLELLLQADSSDGDGVRNRTVLPLPLPGPSRRVVSLLTIRGVARCCPMSRPVVLKNLQLRHRSEELSANPIHDASAFARSRRWRKQCIKPVRLSATVAIIHVTDGSLKNVTPTQNGSNSP